MARRKAPPIPEEDAPRTEFGRWLQELRARRGLGVRELAARLGKEHSYVYVLETGRIKEPPLSVLVALARELGVSLLEVIRRLHGPEVEEALSRAIMQEKLGLMGLEPEIVEQMMNLGEAVKRTLERQARQHARQTLDQVLTRLLDEGLDRLSPVNGEKWSGSGESDPQSSGIIPLHADLWQPPCN